MLTQGSLFSTHSPNPPPPPGPQVHKTAGAFCLVGWGGSLTVTWTPVCADPPDLRPKHHLMEGKLNRKSRWFLQFQPLECTTAEVTKSLFHASLCFLDSNIIQPGFLLDFQFLCFWFTVFLLAFAALMDCFHTGPFRPLTLPWCGCLVLSPGLGVTVNCSLSQLLSVKLLTSSLLDPKCYGHTFFRIKMDNQSNFTEELSTLGLRDQLNSPPFIWTVLTYKIIINWVFHVWTIFLYD